MEEKNIFENEFDRQYGESYREGNSAATNSDHQLPGNAAAPSEGTESLTTEATAGSEAAGQLAKEVAPKDLEKEKYMVFGYDPEDFVNTLYPNGPNCRHDAARDAYNDLLVLYDGNWEMARNKLLSFQWVKDLIAERTISEIDRIVEGGRKLFQKRESENFNSLQPSKAMRKAIEQVTGRKYSVLKLEQRGMQQGKAAAMQLEILQTLENIGAEFAKLTPYFPLLKLLFFRLKQKYYPASFFVGGSFAMTLMTRCWYYFWPKPGKKNRLNSLVMLIGRMGGMKSVAVDLEEIMMEPIHVADAPQIAALNASNAEREQNNGGAKNKKPRPTGVYRALPPETSTAALREAEANAHEMLNGEEYYMHVSIFDSELQNTLSQLKKSYFDALQTYWLKSFHSEKHGAYLKTSNAPVGETPVHFNACYTGTEDAAKAIISEKTVVNGLMSRFTIVPNADSNFEMLEPSPYDDAARQRDAELREWAYKLDSCKGEIPCEPISKALQLWTKHHMADAGEDNDLAQEDLVKRPCWHAINFVLAFVLSRHWSEMVQDTDGKWKCGPNFKTDQKDVRLAILIANAQLAFQEHFCKAILEKHYDDLAAEQASNVRHKQKTWLGYRRLPNPFSSEDVDKAFEYGGKTGSICSRLKRLQDQGLVQKITSGKDKGKYRKLM
ncbi:MAG: hypothetical protein IJ604_05260 [Prevotella sp.]|nr:hypothetical protein [Prevotella sp.]MBR1462772.1 hypothetical protein [Prevotella sp.]